MVTIPLALHVGSSSVPVEHGVVRGPLHGLAVKLNGLGPLLAGKSLIGLLFHALQVWGQLYLGADMCPTLREPEAIAVKVQAIGHAIGHTIGRHLAILNFWQGMGRKEQQQLRRRSPFPLGSPPASITGSDGSIVGLSSQGKIHSQKASSDKQASKDIKKSLCALCWLERDTTSTWHYPWLGVGMGMGGEEVPKSTVCLSKKSVRRLIQGEKGRATTSGSQEPSHGKNLFFQREVRRAVKQIPLTDLSDPVLPSFLLYSVISENLLLLEDHSHSTREGAGFSAEAARTHAPQQSCPQGHPKRELTP